MEKQQALMPLDISYDLVYCIDCLSEEEQAKYKISQELIDFLASIGVKNSRIICPDKKAFIEACSYLEKRAKEGTKFCLHIVSHGNNDGIGIKATGEPILWADFGDMLGVINKEMSNGLIINFTSCMGLHGIKIAEYVKTPFFGLIGYSEKLKIAKGKAINELFYTKLSEGKPIQEIIPEIQKELNDNNLYCISTEGYNTITKNKIL